MDPVLEWLLGELERATKKIEKDSADAWRHVTCLCGLPSELSRARADIEAIQGGVEGRGRRSGEGDVEHGREDRNRCLDCGHEWEGEE